MLEGLEHPMPPTDWQVGAGCWRGASAPLHPWLPRASWVSSRHGGCWPPEWTIQEVKADRTVLVIGSQHTDFCIVLLITQGLFTMEAFGRQGPSASSKTDSLSESLSAQDASAWMAPPVWTSSAKLTEKVRSLEIGTKGEGFVDLGPMSSFFKGLW